MKRFHMKTLYTYTQGETVLYKIVYAIGTLYVSFMPLNKAIYGLQQIFGRPAIDFIMMSTMLGGMALCVIGLILALCGVGDETKAWALDLADRRRRIPRKKAVPEAVQEEVCRPPFPAICRVEAVHQQM